MLSRAITLSAILALASAQGLSSSCISALASIASNPSASACLNPSPLISIFLSGSNSSIVAPVNSWLTGLCAAGPCSNDTLSAITTNVTTGCQAELGALGIQNAGQVVPIVQQAYPIVRDVVCLKDANDNGTLCVTQTLNHIESIQGPITISTITSWVANGIPQTVTPSNVTCTNCVKQMYNVINQQAPSLLGSSTSNSLKSECGDSFVDGQTPVGISESASAQGSSTGSSGSGALGLNMPQSGALGGVSALVLISSVFAFLG